MKDLLHELWPLAAVVALTVVLALQIPRKALLFSPVETDPPAVSPAASFVEYRAEAYARVLQKVRMSWQVRAQGVDPRFGSRIDVMGADEEPAPPPLLALPAGFSVSEPARATAVVPVPLRPPSLADSAPPAVVLQPPDAGLEARAFREELLQLPESLKEKEKENMP